MIDKDSVIRLTLEILCIFMLSILSITEFLANKSGLEKYMLNENESPIDKTFKDILMIIFVIIIIYPILWLIRYSIDY